MKKIPEGYSKLDEDIMIQEKILIEFMTDYYNFQKSYCDSCKRNKSECDIQNYIESISYNGLPLNKSPVEVYLKNDIEEEMLLHCTKHEDQ